VTEQTQVRTTQLIQANSKQNSDKATQTHAHTFLCIPIIQFSSERCLEMSGHQTFSLEIKRSETIRKNEQNKARRLFSNK